MAKAKDQSVDEHLASERASRQALFARCEEREGRIEAIPYRKRIHDLSKHLLFLQPVFWAKPIGGYKPFEKDAYQQRFPFDFSIAPPLHLKVSDREWRYQALLRQLKKLPDVELRWLLISRWLQQEGFCEPDEFLPKAILERLITRFTKTLPWSPEVLHHTVLMDCWRHYFDRLMADLSRAPETNQGNNEWLMKRGYEREAIECCLDKKSSIPAIAEWLERRTKIDARTLENDYSKARRQSYKHSARI